MIALQLKPCSESSQWSDRHLHVYSENPRTTSMMSMRCFLAIAPPPESLLAIDSWRRQNWPTLTRAVKPANYHLTLAFLGDTDASHRDRLCDSLQAINTDAFALTLDDTGYFPDSRMLWIGPRKIAETAKQLATRCRQLAGRNGIRTNKHPWQAHLTLARRVSPPPPPLSAPSFLFAVERFGLYESILAADGARYRLLQDWPLQ